MKYIVTRESHEVYNFDESEKYEVEKISLFYLKSIGKRRIYRRGINETDKDFIIYKFDTEKEAKEQADYLNKDLNHEVKYKVEIVK